jgi:hypothetical protein
MTIFSFVLGAIWHQPFLFGKIWNQENYPGNIKPKINAPLIFGGTAIMHLLAISALSAVVSGMGGMDGLLTGLLIALVWILPAMSGTYLFASRSVKLLAIDAGMYLVLFPLSGLVLGTW